MHPSAYVINTHGVPKGVGLIASRDYGAFNLAWGMSRGQWQTLHDQEEFVTAFVLMQQYTKFTIAGTPLGDYLTLIKPGAVPALMGFRDNQLPPPMQKIVVGAAAQAYRMQEHL
jgi:hypothetical protein